MLLGSSTKNLSQQAIPNLLRREAHSLDGPDYLFLFIDSRELCKSETQRKLCAPHRGRTETKHGRFAARLGHMAPPPEANFMSKSFRFSSGVVLAFCFVGLLRAGYAGAQNAPIRIKVVVVTMFEPGEDLGDKPGEFQLWVEREHLDQVLPLAAGYHHVRLNKDGVLGMVTGVGTAKAAASVMALGLDPRFDCTKAYWVVAGIGGGDPADVSLGSAVWAEHVIDGDLAYEIDAREIPKNWSTGYVPLRKRSPYEEPPQNDSGQMYTLNDQLVSWALNLTKSVNLRDSEHLREFRTRFAGFPNAQKPPFVTKGDLMSSSTFWHGAKMNEWANAWTRYYTDGKGNYMVSAMEDTGTLQALTFLSAAGRADLRRVLVLRTVSNYDREAPGIDAAQSLRDLSSGNYSAYTPALEAAETVGDVVVRDIVEHWADRDIAIPHSH
jgi:purine nucleoside permease